MVTKRRQCNGSRRRQSTASVIETRFTEALRRISRVATREPIVPVRPRFQNSREIVSSLVSIEPEPEPPRDEEEGEISVFFTHSKSEGSKGTMVAD